ncbi:MAG: flagellar basal body rod protein FlgF [Panacagrimonas sp.]
MDRALYIAMTGARESMRAQATLANNLANVSTTGFKAELVASESRNVDGAGQPTRVNTVLRPGGWDASSGPLMQTGRGLDVALHENCWIAVQAPDGSEAFTRAGDLAINAVGQLLTGAGHPVLGDGGPLAIPQSASVAIGSDGTVSVVPLGQGPETQASIGRLRIVSAAPETLERGTDGLMRARRNASPDAAAGNVLTTGALEGSNVNLAEAMVGMIEQARNFELQVKLMRSVEENAAASSSLMKMS